MNSQFTAYIGHVALHALLCISSENEREISIRNLILKNTVRTDTLFEDCFAGHLSFLSRYGTNILWQDIVA